MELETNFNITQTTICKVCYEQPFLSYALPATCQK